jgi:hypothetical protein
MSIEGSLAITPQISADGLFWCDEGRATLMMTKTGVYSFPLLDFGNWLRLRADVNGTVKVMLYLVLKE